MTTATTFRVGDVVPNYVDPPITITGVRADEIYESAHGGEWIAVADDGKTILFPYDALPASGNGAARPAADVHPVANETGLTFQVDVSRTYSNKDGYRLGGYRLNTSFVTETHNSESFIETVVKQGWPYTMVHAKLSPQETGAAARGVLTPKHTENFTSTQLLTFDDDSRLPGVVDFWMNEPFFSHYGLAFVESVNSEPGKAEKGHPTLLLDRPITDPALYRECLKAYYYAFPRLDVLTNVDRTMYNAQGARVHMVGAVCPFEKFKRTYLEPYREAEREKSAAIEAEREWRRQEAERAKAEGRLVLSSQEETYLAGYLRWLFDLVAAKRAGDNRNKATYWAGRCIAGLEATEWARPYHHLLADVDARIIVASAANGYLSDHAHDDEREVLRIFNLGRRAGGEPLEASTPRPSLNGSGPAMNGAAGQSQEGTAGLGSKTAASHPKSVTHSSVYIAELEALGYTFRLNELDDTIEVNGKPISDPIRAKIFSQMGDRGFKGMERVEHVFTGHAYDNRYHPVRDYLLSLKWDGLNHFDRFMDYLTFAENETSARAFTWRWLLGAAGKVLNHDQNFMLVLDGRQDMGKSFLVRWLCPLPDYFIEGAIQPDDKDSTLRLIRHWIWEVGELQSTTRKADREALKNFVTTVWATVRKPFGRYDLKKPACASLIGTVNESGSGFLDDRTGSRRFAVVNLRSIDWSYSQAVDVNQLWAEVVAAYQSGERGALTRAEKQEQLWINAGYSSLSSVEEYLWHFFGVDTSSAVWLPVREILVTLELNGLTGNQRANMMELAQILKAKEAEGVTKGRPKVDGVKTTSYKGLRETP